MRRDFGIFPRYKYFISKFGIIYTSKLDCFRFMREFSFWRTQTRQCGSNNTQASIFDPCYWKMFEHQVKEYRGSDHNGIAGWILANKALKQVHFREHWLLCIENLLSVIEADSFGTWCWLIQAQNTIRVFLFYGYKVLIYLLIFRAVSRYNSPGICEYEIASIKLKMITLPVGSNLVNTHSISKNGKLKLNMYYRAV